MVAGERRADLANLYRLLLQEPRRSVETCTCVYLHLLYLQLFVLQFFVYLLFFVLQVLLEEVQAHIRQAGMESIADVKVRESSVCRDDTERPNDLTVL